MATSLSNQVLFRILFLAAAELKHAVPINSTQVPSRALVGSGQVRSGLHAKLASPAGAQARNASSPHGFWCKIQSRCSTYSKIR